jgi:hypothetical protein
MAQPPLAYNALLVYPRFSPHSFWNYHETCQVVGARYSAAPLGLITVAALLPQEWNLRLVDRNVTNLRESDLQWADIVLTGGMLPQQIDTLQVVREAHRHGKPVVVGGPDVTASPEQYGEAEFVVLGEAEDVLPDLVAAWLAGAAGGRFQATTFPDITRSPTPRFDLLDFRRYMHVGVQRSRGCPFNCEFCNVIELNGRRPRTKTTEQMLSELETLRRLGYRGHVDFVDDNLIGDIRGVKPFLAALGRWLRDQGEPFEFSTEATINLAEDEELLALMQRANFFAIFVGVETPDVATLVQTQKRQNTRRDIADSIHRIYRAGMFVNAGFIIGFDGEKGPVAEAMCACIEAIAVPVCMIGLLYALPTTQLARRLQQEGRLPADFGKLAAESEVDQCTTGLNFETQRPKREILNEYRDVLRKTYHPAAFFARVERMARELDVSCNRYRPSQRATLRNLRSFARIVVRLAVRNRKTRGPFLSALWDCMRHNPRAIRMVVSLSALYLHYGPFAREMDRRLHEQIETLPAPETSAVPLRMAMDPNAVRARVHGAPA